MEELNFSYFTQQGFCIDNSNEIPQLQLPWSNSQPLSVQCYPKKDVSQSLIQHPLVTQSHNLEAAGIVSNTTQAKLEPTEQLVPKETPEDWNLQVEDTADPKTAAKSIFEPPLSQRSHKQDNLWLVSNTKDTECGHTHNEVSETEINTCSEQSHDIGELNDSTQSCNPNELYGHNSDSSTQSCDHSDVTESITVTKSPSKLIYDNNVNISDDPSDHMTSCDLAVPTIMEHAPSNELMVVPSGEEDVNEYEDERSCDQESCERESSDDQEVLDLSNVERHEIVHQPPNTSDNLCNTESTTVNHTHSETDNEIDRRDLLTDEVHILQSSTTITTSIDELGESCVSQVQHKDGADPRPLEEDGCVPCILTPPHSLVPPPLLPADPNSPFQRLSCMKLPSIGSEHLVAYPFSQPVVSVLNKEELLQRLNRGVQDIAIPVRLPSSVDGSMEGSPPRKKPKITNCEEIGIIVPKDTDIDEMEEKISEVQPLVLPSSTEEIQTEHNATVTPTTENNTTIVPTTTGDDTTEHNSALEEHDSTVNNTTAVPSTGQDNTEHNSAIVPTTENDDTVAIVPTASCDSSVGTMPCDETLSCRNETTPAKSRDKSGGAIGVPGIDDEASIDLQLIQQKLIEARSLIGAPMSIVRYNLSKPRLRIGLSRKTQCQRLHTTNQ